MRRSVELMRFQGRLEHEARPSATKKMVALVMRSTEARPPLTRCFGSATAMEEGRAIRAGGGEAVGRRTGGAAITSHTASGDSLAP
jgi:hypothetical protein